MATEPQTFQHPVEVNDSKQTPYSGPAPPYNSFDSAPYPVQSSAPYPVQAYPPAPSGPSGYSHPPQPGTQYNPYPGQVGYAAYSAPPTDPQQQQQSTVIITAGQTAPVITQYLVPSVSYTGHIVFACFVFWCCGWLFGAVAFFLALAAQNASQEDNARATSLGRASIALSIVGLLVGIAIIVAIVVVNVAYARSSSSSSSYSHTCYNYYSGYYSC